jgi:hypothetical protein
LRAAAGRWQKNDDSRDPEEFMINGAHIIIYSTNPDADRRSCATS